MGVGERGPSESPGKQKKKNRLGKNGNKDIKWHQEAQTSRGLKDGELHSGLASLQQNMHGYSMARVRPNNCLSSSE